MRHSWWWVSFDKAYLLVREVVELEDQGVDLRVRGVIIPNRMVPLATLATPESLRVGVEMAPSPWIML